MLAGLAVAVGGATGALARYGADRLVEHVNRHHAPSWLGLGLVTGFLGAYTTYSMFAQETYDLVDVRPGLALVNIVATVSIGLVAVWAGGVVGRHL